MKTFTALLWLEVASLAFLAGGSSPSAAEALTTAPATNLSGALAQRLNQGLVLGDKEARTQLTFDRKGLRLRAFEEVLLSPSEQTPAPQLWLDQKLLKTAGTNDAPLVAHALSNEWDYASVDLTAVYGPRLRQFKRHLLYVQPDLFVICDEFSLAAPATIDLGLWSSKDLTFDSARQEWRGQRTKAGLTARLFGSPKAGWRCELNSNPAKPLAADRVPLGCLLTGVTNQTTEFRQVTVLVVHEGEKKRSLAFKVLESDNAIGVRVHRDGLPTLIAFSKLANPTEATLAGLKFSGPVAVDVFHAKRK